MRALKNRLPGGNRTLYLLATSDRPDPYVNVLVHALETIRPAKIVFVEIVETSDDEEEAVEHVRSVYSNIERMLRGLSKGNYANQNFSEGNPISITEAESKIYAKCLASFSRIETGIITVPWAELDRRIGEFVGAGIAIFDVTTLKKNLLVDVVTILLSRGCLEFYTFELKVKPQHDHRDLIHNLGTTGFRYRRVSDSPHVDTARRRLVTKSSNVLKFYAVNTGVGAVVLAVQFAFPATWLDRLLIALATAASIGALILIPLNKDKLEK